MDNHYQWATGYPEPTGRPALDAYGNRMQGQTVNGNLRTGDTFYVGDGPLRVVKDSYPAGVVCSDGQQFFYREIDGRAVFA